MSDISVQPEPVRSYNISEKYFDECFPVRVAGQHVANVFYSPSRKKGNVTRIFETQHGFGGSPIEFCLMEMMNIAADYGFDKVAIEVLDLSVTNGKPKILENMTLSQLRFGQYATIKSRHLKRILDRSVYNIMALHSLANRGWHDLLAESCVYDNNASKVQKCKLNMKRILAETRDETMSLQPYCHPAPGLLAKKYKSLERDPTGQVWKVLARKPNPKPQKRTEIIPGMEFVVPSCAGLFDIEIISQWRDCFDDYGKFIKNVVRAFNGENIDIFADQGNFIKKVAYTLSDKPVTAILGTDDLYSNHIFNIPFFKKLSDMNPKIFSSYVIEGGDHYFENTKNEFSNVVDKIMYERCKRMRGSK